MLVGLLIFFRRRMWRVRDDLWVVGKLPSLIWLGWFFILSAVSLHVSLSRGMDVAPESLKHNCFKQWASCCYSDLVQQTAGHWNSHLPRVCFFQISTKEDVTWQRNQKVMKKNIEPFLAAWAKEEISAPGAWQCRRETEYKQTLREEREKVKDTVVRY